MTTFVNLRKRASQRYGDPAFSIIADKAASTLPGWDDYVNEAYRDVVLATPLWPWNEVQPTNLSFPANTFTGVALGTDIWQVEAVWDATNLLPLVPLEGRNQYLQEYPSQNEVGNPMHYRVFGAKLYVYPVPTATTAIRIDAISRPADLSADGDIPIFPTTYHHVLVEGALARAYTDDGNVQDAGAAQQRFDKILASMKVDLLQFRQDRYPEIIDAFL